MVLVDNVFRPIEYRDLGNWVLVQVEVRGEGRDRIEVQMRTFEIFRVQEGKIAVYRAFRSEPEALEAAGLPE